MVSIISWIKKELEILKDSFPQIVQGFILFILFFSGFGCALFLRYQGFNGAIIATAGIIVEAIGIFICYLFFKAYLLEETEKGSTDKKKRK